jgi:hypothetical protein
MRMDVRIFKKVAAASKKHIKYMFWQNEYHPIELSTHTNDEIEAKIYS